MAFVGRNTLNCVTLVKMHKVRLASRVLAAAAADCPGPDAAQGTWPMTSPGMAAIHGRVGRLHAKPTQRLNTRTISSMSVRITSLLAVDCAQEFARKRGGSEHEP
jgi:hypothetical protein